MTTSPNNAVKELVCRKVAGGKCPKRRHDLGKGPVRTSSGRKGVRKCRYRPGAFALKEVRLQYQRSTELLISKIRIPAYAHCLHSENVRKFLEPI